MVAEKRSRRKGIAKEALQLMMQYCIRFLEVTSFIAKIINTNEPSIDLFSSIGFVKLKDVPVFKEVHYVLNMEQCPLEWSNLHESSKSLPLLVISGDGGKRVSSTNIG